jgi:hypothetical protein
MQTFDPGFFEMQHQSEEWCKEREQLMARVTTATSFSRKYAGVYEQLQESFNLRRTIDASMLRLDKIGPPLLDHVAAIKWSRAFVEGIEREMGRIEAMSTPVAKSSDFARTSGAMFKPINLPPSPALVAARRSAALEQRMTDLEAVVKATLAPPAQRPADSETDDGPVLYTGQYL